MASSTSVLPLQVGSMKPVGLTSDPTDVRKRSLDFLSSERVSPLPPPITSSATFAVEPLHKKSKQHHEQTVVSSDDDEAGSLTGTTTKKSNTKKPQMKYDPDVPMSKEEATAWRREQRRKRNRESAAASRQRQRDRITELEAELEQWKSACDAVEAKIRALEEQSPSFDVTTTKAAEDATRSIRADSPEPPVAILAPPASPTTSTFLDLSGDGLDKPLIPQQPTSSLSPVQEQQHQQPQPLKMISRHA